MTVLELPGDGRKRVVPRAGPPADPQADPLAELARLCRPPGPWLHLLDGAPSDGRQLGWMLGHDGVVVRLLRGHCLRTAYGLYDETAAALQLPGDPVEDWAGLATLLTDMGWLPGAGHVLVITRAALLLAAAPLAGLGEFVSVVRDVAKARAEEGDPVPFHIVLQDDTISLTTLRARLDAVGGRYDELSEWDAEEPAAAPVPSRRSVYVPGDPHPDAVDHAVAAALSTRDDVVEVRRCWEEFRGSASAPVRVYCAVLSTPDDGAVQVAAAAAAAAAHVGASCLVLPATDRHHTVAATGTVIWAAPSAAVETAPAAQAAPAATGAVTPRTAQADHGTTEVSPTGQPADGHPPAPPNADHGRPTDPAADSAAAGPADDPDSYFELVAANLEWTFDRGADALDGVDEALIGSAVGSAQAVSVFRTWVRDPAGGWVRVVIEYVGSGSIAGVEAERDRVVKCLQRAGAKRCCVEIVGTTDVGDVHRWLEDRCVPLVRDRQAVGTTRPTPTLPADAVFEPGPEDGAGAARLVDWASNRSGIIGLVTAWTEVDGRRLLVVGVVADGDVDQAAIRAEAEAILGVDDAHLVEPFAPSTGMTPTHLSLYRGSSRLWTRSVDRRAAPTRGLDTTYRAHLTTVDSVLDPMAPLADERLPDGFTVVALDLNTPIEAGPEEPDERDAAVTDWLRRQGHALALLRAFTARPRQESVPVYSVVVDADADRSAVRHGVARIVAGTGLDRCGVEVFCPFERLSLLHVELYRSSITLCRLGSRNPT